MINIQIIINNRITKSLFTFLHHSLCNPINAIIDYSEMILDKLYQNQTGQTQIVSDVENINICGHQLLAFSNALFETKNFDSTQFDFSHLQDILSDSAVYLELLTPISAITGYCELLLEDADAELATDLDFINRAARQLLALVDDIVNQTDKRIDSISIDKVDTLNYQQQLERFTIAASEVAAKTFNPESLTDLTQRTDKLGQFAQVFQRMAIEVREREEYLRQQVEMLKISIDEVQKKRTIASITKTAHFRELEKRVIHEYSEVSSPTLNITSTSKIISVHSYRGGTGKSNLIGNLGYCLALQGLRVGIIDVDIQSPGIHTLFGLEETIKWTLNDYLWERCGICEAVYDVSHKLEKFQLDNPDNIQGKLYLIPSSVNTNNITRILREGYDEEMLVDGFEELIHNLQLDYLLIDTHPGVNEEILRALTVCHLLIIILRPDYQDYQGTAIIVELARILGVSQLKIVVNKTLPMLDSEFQQQVKNAYNVSVAGLLPLCDEMRHLASSDIFCLHYPNHPWSEVIHEITKEILVR